MGKLVLGHMPPRAVSVIILSAFSSVDDIYLIIITHFQNWTDKYVMKNETRLFFIPLVYNINLFSLRNIYAHTLDWIG